MPTLIQYILIVILLIISVIIIASIFFANNRRNILIANNNTISSIFDTALTLSLPNGSLDLVASLSATSRTSDGGYFFATTLIPYDSLPTQFFTINQSTDDPSIVTIKNTFTGRYINIIPSITVPDGIPAKYPTNTIVFNRETIESPSMNPRLWFKLLITTNTTTLTPVYQFRWLADDMFYISTSGPWNIHTGFQIPAGTITKTSNFLVLGETPTTFMLDTRA